MVTGCLLSSPSKASRERDSVTAGTPFCTASCKRLLPLAVSEKSAFRLLGDKVAPGYTVESVTSSAVFSANARRKSLVTP